ncbi:MAG TPA: pyridoxine 5'-phosphate synthase, partial [Verrucomicrobiae bacterium]|nr:pyridoxine 5'-phosphate synthase [Verrucomicrobiae bacterium]
MRVSARDFSAATTSKPPSVVTSSRRSGTMQTISGRNFSAMEMISGAQQAHALGLKVNAGHGLNYENLPSLFRVP